MRTEGLRRLPSTASRSRPPPPPPVAQMVYVPKRPRPLAVPKRPLDTPKRPMDTPKRPLDTPKRPTEAGKRRRCADPGLMLPQDIVVEIFVERPPRVPPPPRPRARYAMRTAVPRRKDVFGKGGLFQ